MIEPNQPILMIHQSQHIGGGQTYVTNITDQLRLAGHPIELLQTDSPIKIIAKLFTTPAKTIIWNIYAEFPLSTMMLARLLAKTNYLIAYGFWSKEARSTFWHHDSITASLKHKLYEIEVFIKQALAFMLSQRIAHLSHYSKNLFNQSGLGYILKHKEQTIIYGDADRKLFQPLTSTQRQDLRKELGIFPDQILLLMAGRADRRKNFTQGLDVLLHLRNSYHQNVFLFFVVSHGEFNDPLYLSHFFKKVHQYELAPYVRVISGVTHAQMAQFYQAVDIFLMLSKELETFGLVTLESLASGCPVFGYDACATPEIVTYKTKLFLSPPKPKVLAKKIYDYLRLPPSRKTVHLKQLVSTIHRFSWANTVTKLMDPHLS